MVVVVVFLDLGKILYRYPSLLEKPDTQHSGCSVSHYKILYWIPEPLLKPVGFLICLIIIFAKC